MSYLVHSTQRAGKHQVKRAMLILGAMFLLVPGIGYAQQKVVLSAQTHSATYDAASNHLLIATGVNLVRLGVNYSTWMHTQPNSNTGWAPYDQAVAAITDSADIQHFNTNNNEKFILTAIVPVATLYNQLLAAYPSPTPAQRDAFIPTQVQTDLTELVTQAKTRYGDRIAAVEIWNEPDGSSTWNNTQLGTFYNAMTGICTTIGSWNVPAVYGYAFSVIPHSSATDTSGASPTAATQLYDDLNSAGAISCMSNISAHYYSTTPENIVAPLQYASTQLASPIALTEYGGTSDPSIRTDDAQANLILRYMLSIFNASPYLASVYEWKDSSNASPGAQQHYGLIHSDDTVKPGYVAFSNITSIYAQATAVTGDSCPSNLCTEQIVTSPYTYTVYWRKDASSTALSTIITDTSVVEKSLASAHDFATVATSTLNVTSTPIIVRVANP